MQIRISKKHSWVCLFLCCFFLTSYINIISTHDIFSADAYAFNGSSISGGSEHSSMNRGTNLWPIDYFAINNALTGCSISSMKPFSLLFTKNIFSILTSLITAQIVCLIYSSSLAGRLCLQFNSIAITVFLHKKDGMK